MYHPRDNIQYTNSEKDVIFYLLKIRDRIKIVKFC